MENKKIIRVTCAIIERGGTILAAQRSSKMGMADKWEFPGGKFEEGEKPEECIVREIKEEMDAEISIICPLPSHVHDYGERVIELIPFVCRILKGDISPKEHKQIIWDAPVNLSGLNWAEADVPILEEYIKYIR